MMMPPAEEGTLRRNKQPPDLSNKLLLYPAAEISPSYSNGRNVLRKMSPLAEGSKMPRLLPSVNGVGALIPKPTTQPLSSQAAQVEPPFPACTEHLLPQDRLTALQLQLKTPSKEVTQYFRQEDLLCVRDAVESLCLISTWNDAQQSDVSTLLLIIRKCEEMLRHAALPHSHGQSDGMLVAGLRKQCDLLFLAVADLDLLAQKLQQAVSSGSVTEAMLMPFLGRSSSLVAASSARRGQRASAQPAGRAMLGTGDMLDLWVMAISRLVHTEPADLERVCGFVFNHLFRHEERTGVFRVAHRLLCGAANNNNIKAALELLLSTSGLYAAAAAHPVQFIDDVVLPFLESSIACSSSPSDLLTLTANLVVTAVGDQDHAVEHLAARLDLKAFGSAAFPHALIVACLHVDSTQQKVARSSSHAPSALARLLRSLARKRKLGRLMDDASIGKGCKEPLKLACDRLFGGPGCTAPFSEALLVCSAEQGGVELYRGCMSPLVVCHARVATGSPVQVQYLSLLSLLALVSSGDEQDDMAAPVGEGVLWAPSDHPLELLHTRLCEVWSFFRDCTPSQHRGHSPATHIHAGLHRHGSRLFDEVCRLARQMSSSKQTGWSLKTRVHHLLETLHHFVDIDKDHLAFLLAHRGRLDRYPSAIDAIEDTIALYTVRRGAPNKWKTADIPGMVFYLFCFAKYPLDSFRGWVADSLASTEVRDGVCQPSRADIEAIFAGFESRRDGLVGRQEIADLGFKCMHHSQAFAVMTAIQQTDKMLNPFLRVGTGQGKSLIIALLAAHHAKQGRKVHIFTCYQHLAQRDHKRFESFYTSLGIKSMSVTGDSSSKLPDSVEVLYSDLHTFLDMRQKCAQRKCKMEEGWDLSDYAGLYREALDVVLLDEFDALVLMHKEVGNTVFCVNTSLPIGHPTLEELSGAAELKRAVAARHPGMSDEYWRGLSACGVDEGITDWLSPLDGWAQGSTGHDALGKSHSYIGGRLHELHNEGVLYGRYLATDCLALLQSARCVIGLSGSISSHEVARFSQLFSRKPCYLEIPPYYGMSETRNMQVARQVGLTVPQWRDAVVGDAAAVLARGRPVLVFLHPSDSQWEQLERELQRAAADAGGTFQVIKTEDNVKDSTLDRACVAKAVTLSSHVAGRGADFVVQNHIKRRGGLHVIIAFQPTQHQKLDVRMVDQMKGRTARMGAPGSFSILTTEDLPPHEVVTVEGKPAKMDAHLISCSLFKHMARSEEATADHWKRYTFFVMFFDEMERLPTGLETALEGTAGVERVDAGRRYLLREVVGMPRFRTNNMQQSRPASPLLHAPSHSNGRGSGSNRHQPPPPPSPPPPPLRNNYVSNDPSQPPSRDNSSDWKLGLGLGGLGGIVAGLACTIQ